MPVMNTGLERGTSENDDYGGRVTPDFLCR
jgi:hypothetical protein